MAKKASKETSLPVVISLVFFVILSIGLGVFTYVLFSDQEAKDAEVAKAAAEVKNSRGLVKDAENIARIHRVFTGLDDGEDRTSILNENIGEGSKPYQELKKLNEMAEKKIPAAVKAAADKAKTDVSMTKEDFVIWPGELDDKKLLKPPTRSLIDLVATAQVQRKLAATQTTSEKDSYATSIGLMSTAEKGYTASAGTYEKAAKDLPVATKAALDKIAADAAKAQEKYKTDIAAARAENDILTTKMQAMELQDRRSKETIERLKTDLNSQVARSADKKDVLQFDEPLGKITNRLPNNVVEIDLGSSDLVLAGLTFTVLPSDYQEKGRQSRMKEFRRPDDKGVYRAVTEFVPKATLEVIEVLGPRLSRARLTSEYDDIRDRVMTGDLLYNTVWRKGQSDHVALIGIFDTNGDGVDDIEAVYRDLTKMGIPVDAYYDLRNQKWVGKITERTRFAVEGYLPLPSANDPQRDAKVKLTGAIKAAKDEATNKGVNVVGFRDFFGKMGYRAKVDVSEDRINQAVSKYLSGIGLDNTPAPPPAP